MLQMMSHRKQGNDNYTQLKQYINNKQF